eukprot:5774651-Pyramimonas_sp.AAC.1
MPSSSQPPLASPTALSLVLQLRIACRSSREHPAPYCASGIPYMRESRHFCMRSSPSASLYIQSG